MTENKRKPLLEQVAHTTASNDQIAAEELEWLRTQGASFLEQPHHPKSIPYRERDTADTTQPHGKLRELIRVKLRGELSI
jgi:hypothetical protein